MNEYLSVDGFPVGVGGRFWNNDLQVVEVREVAVSSNAYADTGETQTWHRTTSGSSDTLSGRLQPYGRLVKVFEGLDASRFPAGTRYADVK